MSQQPSQSPPRTDNYAAGMNQAMSALSYLFGGILVYGGLGWLGAHFLHIGALLPIGMVFGIGLGVYLIIRHYGSPGERATADWIDQRENSRSEWARRAGRPTELGPRPDGTAAAAVSGAETGTAPPSAAQVLRRR